MTTEDFERYVHLGRQRDAHRLVSIAVREGRLLREPCQVCGSTIRVDGHHQDYAKPLEVIWLCRSCHQLVTKLERMLKECGEAVRIAVESRMLWPLAEVFAQELTNRAHRNPHWNIRYSNELRDIVEKCLALLLLPSVLKKTVEKRRPGRPRRQPITIGG